MESKEFFKLTKLKALILCLLFILITGCTDKNNIDDVSQSTSANNLSETDINKLPLNIQDIAKASNFVIY